MYEYCRGCDMMAAQHCLWDMRHNVSGNVPPTCNLDFNTLKPQTECCARYRTFNKFFTIHGRTSAINDALACLRNIGCQDTLYYMTLERECQFYTCNTVYVNHFFTRTTENRGDIRERGTRYTKDDSTDQRFSVSGDGLMNGCLADGTLAGHSQVKSLNSSTT